MLLYLRLAYLVCINNQPSDERINTGAGMKMYDSLKDGLASTVEKPAQVAIRAAP